MSPGIGQGLLFTQGGAGTSPGYSALDDRRASTLGLQEGIYNATDFAVSQRAAGANMSVDIGMPAGGFACVQGDAVSGQGLYTVPVHSATDNLAITAANPTNPRVDQVILEVFDNVHDVSGNNLAQTRVVAGTATAGATLTNRTGAAALPASALLLADVLVGAAVTTIPNTVIRDRRKWARGAHMTLVSGVTSPGDYSLASGVAASTSNKFNARVELSGAPIRFDVMGLVANNTASTNVFLRGLMDNATVLDSGPTTAPGAGLNAFLNPWAVLSPAAGSRVFDLSPFCNGGGVVTLRDSAGVTCSISVREIVGINTKNNSVTTG